MDSDGAEDMMIGDGNGFLNYFKNAAPSGSPASFPAITYHYKNIDVGNNATPQIIDMNDDGLPDIITGYHRGYIKYFQNTGSPTSPNFNTAPTEGYSR